MLLRPLGDVDFLVYDLDLYRRKTLASKIMISYTQSISKVLRNEF